VPLDPPAECGFARRCAHFIAGRCDRRVPDLIEVEPGHQVRCVLYAGQGQVVYGTEASH
jgi:hypothetical protein